LRVGEEGKLKGRLGGKKGVGRGGGVKKRLIFRRREEVPSRKPRVFEEGKRGKPELPPFSRKKKVCNVPLSQKPLPAREKKKGGEEPPTHPQLKKKKKAA